MKKIQLIFTLLAFMLAGAGVFASSIAPVVIIPRIDSNDVDEICDQQVTTECNSPTGQPCTYRDGSVNKDVFNLENGSCQLLYKPN